MIRIVLYVASMAIYSLGFSQKKTNKNLLDQDNFVSVNIEKITDDVKQSFQQNYSTKGMTEEEKEKFVQKLTDSIWTSNSKPISSSNNQLKIQLANNQVDNLTAYADPDGKNIKLKVHISIGSQEIYREINVAEQRITGVNMFELAKGIPELNEDLLKKYNAEIDKNKTLENFIAVKEKLETDSKTKETTSLKETVSSSKETITISTEGESSTIKKLNVSIAENTKNQIKISFKAVLSSDVYIIVTNLAGKEIATKRIVEHEGEYNDVLLLPESTIGTVFVNVIQGNDGAVKRISID